MQRSLILMAAAVFSLVACTDVRNRAITAPMIPGTILPTPSTLTLSGRISVTGLVDYDRKSSCGTARELYRLVGSHIECPGQRRWG
jgi:hypothetical protein